MRELLGERGVVSSTTGLCAYESDGLALIAVRPELVCLPSSTAETAACMKLLHTAGVPVVGRGAGTGLSGGATPVEGGVVVSTARMRQVLEVDPENLFARVQAGVVNVDLTGACAHHGLLYAPDPSSQMACTIGGNVAENSGGPHCFKYGATTQHVLGLVIVTHDGEVLDLSEPAVDPDGYDLIGLFTGSEGTFGIATEVTVRLVRAPRTVEVLLAIFDDLDTSCDAVSDIIAAKLEPSAMEILDRLTIEAVERSVFAAGYPTDADAVLLIEVEGEDVEVESTSRAIVDILRARGALDQ